MSIIKYGVPGTLPWCPWNSARNSDKSYNINYNSRVRPAAVNPADIDSGGATVAVDAKGTPVTPGLIDGSVFTFEIIRRWVFITDKRLQETIKALFSNE